MELKYKHYPDASDISDKLLQQIYERQIIAWGEEPFAEYKICTNSSCRRIYSIEEVHGNVANMEEGGDDFCCTEEGCGKPTDYMYKSEEFFASIHEYVKHNVSMVLLTTQEEELRGFGVLSQGTIESMVKLNFSPRQSYDVDKVVQDLSRKLFDCDDASDERVICFHQIFVDANTRKEEPNAALNLLKELFFAFSEDFYHLPVVGETRFDINFYPMSRALGFEDVANDKYGYTIHGIKRYSQILEYLRTHPTMAKMIPDMIKYKREAKAILSKRRVLTGSRKEACYNCSN